jgi:hypothetical protein
MTGTAAQPSAKKQLALFVAQFSPEIAKRARSALATMRKRLPGAFELVYDNAYALVVGFSPSERPSEALFSIVVYPRKVSLCFLQGARLPNPEGLLQGSGKQVRHIRLDSADTLDRRGVRALIRAALEDAGKPFGARRRGRTVVRAISRRQRPRRPPMQRA